MWVYHAKRWNYELHKEGVSPTTHHRDTATAGLRLYIFVNLIKNLIQNEIYAFEACILKAITIEPAWYEQS